eukprot:gene3427-2378_t
MGGYTVNLTSHTIIYNNRQTTPPASNSKEIQYSPLNTIKPQAICSYTQHLKPTTIEYPNLNHFLSSLTQSPIHPQVTVAIPQDSNTIPQPPHAKHITRACPQARYNKHNTATATKQPQSTHLLADKTPLRKSAHSKCLNIGAKQKQHIHEIPLITFSGKCKTIKIQKTQLNCHNDLTNSYKTTQTPNRENKSATHLINWPKNTPKHHSSKPLSHIKSRYNTTTQTKNCQLISMKNNVILIPRDRVQITHLITINHQTHNQTNYKSLTIQTIIVALSVNAHYSKQNASSHLEATRNPNEQLNILIHPKSISTQTHNGKQRNKLQTVRVKTCGIPNHYNHTSPTTNTKSENLRKYHKSTTTKEHYKFVCHNIYPRSLLSYKNFNSRILAILLITKYNANQSNTRQSCKRSTNISSKSQLIKPHKSILKSSSILTNNARTYKPYSIANSSHGCKSQINATHTTTKLAGTVNTLIIVAPDRYHKATINKNVIQRPPKPISLTHYQPLTNPQQLSKQTSNNSEKQIHHNQPSAPNTYSGIIIKLAYTTNNQPPETLQIIPHKPHASLVAKSCSNNSIRLQFLKLTIHSSNPKGLPAIPEHMHHLLHKTPCHACRTTHPLQPKPKYTTCRNKVSQPPTHLKSHNPYAKPTHQPETQNSKASNNQTFVSTAIPDISHQPTQQQNDGSTNQIPKVKSAHPNTASSTQTASNANITTQLQATTIPN